MKCLILYYFSLKVIISYNRFSFIFFSQLAYINIQKKNKTIIRVNKVHIHILCLNE